MAPYSVSDSRELRLNTEIPTSASLTPSGFLNLVALCSPLNRQAFFHALFAFRVPFSESFRSNNLYCVSTAYPFMLLVVGTRVIPKTPRKIPFSETLHFLRRQLQGFEDYRQGDLLSLENKSTSLKVFLSKD